MYGRIFELYLCNSISITEHGLGYGFGHYLNVYFSINFHREVIVGEMVLE